MSAAPDLPLYHPGAAGASLVRVVPYAPGRPDHRAAFRDLNLAWIEAHFAVEARDRRELDDPERHILAHGGQILMAEADGPDAVAVLGTCALLREPDGAFELAKMAVHPAARGRGVGRALGHAAIAAARGLGARRVDLLSNTVLGPAIGLYRALGFVEVSLPATDYARANIKMVLDLAALPAPAPPGVHAARDAAAHAADPAADSTVRDGDVRFDTRVAVLLRDDLLPWQRLNVTAFVVSGIAGLPGVLGEPYEDASGRRYLPMLRQPVLVFRATREQLRAAYDRAVAAGAGPAAEPMALSVYTAELFGTPHDAANRAAVRAVRGEALDLVGLAVRGRRKPVEKLTKGLPLHP